MLRLEGTDFLKKSKANRDEIIALIIKLVRLPSLSTGAWPSLISISAVFAVCKRNLFSGIHVHDLHGLMIVYLAAGSVSAGVGDRYVKSLPGSCRV